MKVSLATMSKDLRRQIKWGVCPTRWGLSLFHIPYTGWGNTVTAHVVCNGKLLNSPWNGDWQWGGSLDRYPDGEVFQCFSEAIAYYENQIGKPTGITEDQISCR